MTGSEDRTESVETIRIEVFTTPELEIPDDVLAEAWEAAERAVYQCLLQRRYYARVEQVR